MILQIIPVKNKIALGSQKLFANRFRPIQGKINAKALKDYVTTTTKSAYKVMLLWTLLVSLIGVLYYAQVLDKRWLFIISVVFYVCDLVCVLIWCPFRLIMKNKCCTTCRIFNWDHLMMFSPLIFVTGVYTALIVLLSLASLLIWEFRYYAHPERFFEESNETLKCKNCKEKLCRKYK
jgi:hypothetical protein